MFGMLKIIFRRDKIATPSFGASELQIMFIFPLRVPGMPREAGVGSFAFP